MEPANTGIDERIVTAFEKIAQVSRMLLWEAASAEKLSPIQLLFLLHIAGGPEELRKVGAIAKEFDLTPPTVSDAVSSLESKGLLIKESSPEDRRSVVLSLTREGRRTVRAVGRWKNTMIETVSSFPEDQKNVAMRFLSGLISSLFEKGVLSSARMCMVCGNMRIADDDCGARYICKITGRRFDESGVMIGCAVHSPKV
ncbi:MAG TPA: MarR family transcriptional regulator [Spirochaetota bacterium]|nr:MarR family transcriptional regulator [Spirochaetota bacterium]